MKMDMFTENADLTNVVPKGIKFSIGKAEYELIYNFKTLLRLSEAYGNVAAAIDALQDADHKHEAVLNFLYCGLADKYQLAKDEIGTWLGFYSTEVFYNLIVSAVTLSAGKNDEGEETDPGEV